ncbi:hypothetical protein TcasGA2_TC012444 [Tribolium castaneum]|uniref:Uncharacterized protein n=1 Tax=Tribolium castaneum TaxID=7070 RepID=D6X2C0_TRICA|nr:hypothetical protein TcasGA2_TC012444 [Tribolium castaneum]
MFTLQFGLGERTALHSRARILYFLRLMAEMLCFTSTASCLWNEKEQNDTHDVTDTFLANLRPKCDKNFYYASTTTWIPRLRAMKGRNCSSSQSMSI